MRYPIGCSDFKTLIDERYTFVDKSLLIQDILNEDAQVILLTRPRRFGKTLNLSMLRYFFASQVYGASTEGLFEGCKIEQNKEIMERYYQKHPVIFLTFKDVKGNTFKETYDKFCNVIRSAYLEHYYLLSHEKMIDAEKRVYQSILDQTATIANMEDALIDLSKYLFQHHGIKPLVLIDEYDTPIQTGYLKGYYSDIISLFRNFFGAGLKDNPFLFKAVLTGILRVSRESLFSGLNNLRVYSVLNPAYGAYFGFTEPEVTVLLKEANLSQTSEDVKRWYNGYQIGETVLYNPWSILNYLSDSVLKPYWVNTADDALIRELLLNNHVLLKDQFAALMENKTIDVFVNEHFIFPNLKETADQEPIIWTLFLMAGYLKNVSSKQTPLETVYQLAVPNFEVWSLYRQIILGWLSADEQGLRGYSEFLEGFLRGDLEVFESYLRRILERVVGLHDTAISPEAFYHGLIVGLIASLHHNPNYEVRSNRESGLGRYDLMILSKQPEKWSFLFEFKKVVSSKKEITAVGQSVLKKNAKAAIQQIEASQYLTEAHNRGLKKIFKIGIAFFGKQFEMVYKK